MIRTLSYLPLSVLLIVFTYLPVYSQGSTNITSQELREFGRQIRSGAARTVKSTRVKGTPYLSEEWSKGYVMINEKTKSETIWLRYDAENNVVEFQRDGNIYAIDSKKIDGFVIKASPQELIFENGYKSGQKEIGQSTLLRIIHDGNTKFVAHHQASLKENQATYGMASQVDEYVKDTDYYIITPDGSFHEVRLKKKDILKAFKDVKDEIEDFAYSNDLSFDEEEDVSEIVSYYNQLASGS